MTLIIALILLGHTDAGWLSYLAVVVAWVAHVAWHAKD